MEDRETFFSSSVSYLNATGGTNGDRPSNLPLNDVNNIGNDLGTDARTMLVSIDAANKFFDRARQTPL